MEQIAEPQEKLAFTKQLLKNVLMTDQLKFLLIKILKIKKKVLPNVHKKDLTKYEASDENNLRSIAVDYSGRVMGKPKYRKRPCKSRTFSHKI